MAQAESGEQEIGALERKERQLAAQIQAPGEQFREALEVLGKEARIAASFSGQLVRIDRKPDNHALLYSILYREVDFQQLWPESGEKVTLRP